MRSRRRRLAISLLCVASAMGCHDAAAAPGGCFDLSQKRCVNHNIDRLIDAGQSAVAYAMAQRYQQYEAEMPAVSRAFLVFRWNNLCNMFMGGGFVGYMSNTVPAFCRGETNPGVCQAYYGELLEHYQSVIFTRLPCSGEDSVLRPYDDLP